MAETRPVRIWLILGIIFSYFIIGMLAWIFKFSITATLLSFVMITIFYGIGFLIHFLLVVQPRRLKEKKLLAEKITPEESKILDLDYLKQEYGIIPREIELDTPKVIGEEGQAKQIWHWFRFKDKFDDFSVDIFRNLTNIELRSVYFNLEKSDAERELISLGSPLSERETFVKKFYDPITGNLLRVEEGILPKQIIEKPVEIVRETGTVEGTGGEDVESRE